ncbi:MAG: hypothetical protein IJH95_07405 [Mogibacterium sp.]|nr:hypothetical protein [Mogibacterium sp.]
MRSDRDKRTDNEKEIDEFLSQFETPVDELSADINSYLDTEDTTRLSAEKNFMWVDHPDEIRHAAPERHYAAAADRSGHVQSGHRPVTVYKDPGPSPKEASDQAQPDAAAGTVSETAQHAAPKHEIRNEPATVKSRSVDKVTTSSYKAGKAAKKEAKQEAKKRAKKAAGKVKKSTFISTAAAGKMLSRIKKVNRKKIREKLFLKPNPAFDPSQPAGKGKKFYA